MQRAAAGESLAVIGNHEVAHVFRELEFGAREHDALRGKAVDEIEQGRNILHGRLADFDVLVRNRGVLDEVGSEGADHLYCRRYYARAMIPVPAFSPAKTRVTISV